MQGWVLLQCLGKKMQGWVPLQCLGKITQGWVPLQCFGKRMQGWVPLQCFTPNAMQGWGTTSMPWEENAGLGTTAVPWEENAGLGYHCSAVRPTQHSTILAGLAFTKQMVKWCKCAMFYGTPVVLQCGTGYSRSGRPSLNLGALLNIFTCGCVCVHMLSAVSEQSACLAT